MGFIQNAEHWAARVAHEFKVEFGSIESRAVTLTPEVKAVSEGLAGVAEGAAVAAGAPQAASVIAYLEAGFEALWGKTVAAIQSADAAAQANGINVALDSQTVANVKQVLVAIEQLKPGSTQVPMLPVPATPAPAATPAAG